MPDQALQAALDHHRSGRIDQAEAIYHELLRKHPDHADAQHLLGLVEHQRGNNAAAAQWIERAIRCNRMSPDFHANLGVVRHAMNQMAEAASALQEALRLNPAHADAQNNLGSALKALGRPAEAIEHFRKAIKVRAEHPAARANLAITLAEMRQFDEAERAFRAAIAHSPNDPGLHFRLGLLLQEIGKLPQAAEEYRRTLALAPSAFEAHANLGNALRELGDFEAAITSYRESLRLRPDLAECHLNLASGLLTIGIVDEALAAGRTALRLKPELEEAHTTTLLALQYRVHPPADVLAAHRQWARLRQAAPRCLPRTVQGGDDAASRPLRVGLISADFFDHPIAYFLEPLLAGHPRDRVQLICYSGVARADGFTQRLQGFADGWRDTCRVGDDDLARLIVEDRIDILIELAGHTSGNRLKVLARKPAPVQVSYLGYATTTGLDTIDFRLTDSFADPPGLTESHYVEQLVRLPRTLACYAPPPQAPPVGPLPALAGGRLTFASFSSPAKIGPETIDLWSRVLKAIPDSRLIIKGRGAAGDTFSSRLRAGFRFTGVDQERIELRNSAAMEHYLAFHNAVDLIVDTFPFNGHTTLCHALWMGVPAVSLAGDRFASRLGASVLNNAGLPQFVAGSPDEFVEIVQQWSGDLPRLAQLRQGLRSQLSASPLMNQQQFSLDFAEAMRHIWRLAAQRAA